jgi:hypothetical protein
MRISNKKVKTTPELRVKVQEIKTNYLESKKSKVSHTTGHEDPEGQQEYSSILQLRR